ncbi:hypothetical protein EI77_03060 [Prosthecobacter fusiformis]|uniref:Uncharacterized protein n=1 Tax=Prosthecobacter fusiformis TaxID=48464 RepID=A0A4R7RXU5_9BACT|nr:hypothetical protein [Prosthecobacter fusiformis]TDU69407.1 hypothetical protein EI77_03060 [Prosthecobacter fusiformis]
MSIASILGNIPDPKDWVVSRIRHDYRRVFIRHSIDVAPSIWIRKLRNCKNICQLPDSARLLLEVRQKGGIDLGVISGRDAYKFTQTLEKAGFESQVEDASYISYFPEGPDGRILIEDEAVVQAFCLELIRLGANVRETEY